ncbi:trigger factor [Eubacterium xylanophilum]|uniref:trigger factor n=1 Tax=Eubacterium xylanophilum TaxID=39497 RepID=UPI00047C5BA3|nr:trigger factor [Eubacterium xylanophilum]
MSFKVENLEKNMAKLTIEVSAEEFEAAMVKSYNKNKKQISVQGFRKGKAPRKMIEKLYGEEIFYEDAANFIIPDAYEKAADESGLDIVSRPEVDVEQIGNGKTFIFTATFAVKPEVKLGEYKGLEVETRELVVTDEEVDAEINKALEQNARIFTVEDRGIEVGDTAIIDFEGFVDGEAFAGGKAENHSLEIGSHSFIDTFEDQLVGKNVGDEVDVNVTFPEEYHEESLKGKPALFKVKINEIKAKELPELDDEFASEVSEFETLAEYKDSIKKSIEERKQAQINAEKENKAIEKLIETSEMEIPDAMIDEQVNQMMNDFAGRLSQQGLSIDQYFKMTGMQPKALMAQMRPDAEMRIKSRLVLEAVADAEKFEVTEEELDKEMESIGEMYNMTLEKIKELFGEDEKKQLESDTKVKKAAALLVESAKEIPVKEEDAE